MGTHILVQQVTQQSKKSTCMLTTLKDHSWLPIYRNSSLQIKWVFSWPARSTVVKKKMPYTIGSLVFTYAQVMWHMPESQRGATTQVCVQI